jgi:CheY-like chemotaxis protein
MRKEPFSVLLVEDDLNDIFLVKRAFKMALITDPLHVVTDGLEAMDYLRGAGKYADRRIYPLPRLIVMHIKMPRKSGFEVLEWMETHGQPLRRVPVVIVSGSDNPADINRAYELGANAYMIKPVDFRANICLSRSPTIGAWNARRRVSRRLERRFHSAGAVSRAAFALRRASSWRVSIEAGSLAASFHAATASDRRPSAASAKPRGYWM